jgi:DNA-binding NarL/FixJ family response regulator
MSALGDYDAAREWLEAASTYAVGHGMIAEVALCRSYEAWIDQDVGVSAEAIERARAAVVELRRHGSERAEALRLLGELHHLRGDPEAALKCFSEAVALGARHAALGRSRVLLAAGRPEEAVEDLRTALSGLGPGHQLLVLRALPVLVEALARAGRTDAAAEALARLEAETAGADDPFSRVAVRQASAVVHAARGELEAAERALNEAVVGWASLTRRLDRLRAVVQLGELLLATSSERARATALMESALRELEALGAAGDAKRARSLLQRHGHRPPPARSPAVAKASHGLTGREREVLQQLVKGSTNKEIARALAMSERTASVHVSHLLRKLRCATRTQAVSYAISQGIVQLSLALAAVRWVGGLLRGR